MARPVGMLTTAGALPPSSSASRASNASMSIPLSSAAESAVSSRAGTGSGRTTLTARGAVAAGAAAASPPSATIADTTPFTRVCVTPIDVALPATSASKLCWASRTFLKARRLSSGARRSSQAATSAAMAAAGDRANRSWTSGNRVRSRCG